MKSRIVPYWEIIIIPFVIMIMWDIVVFIIGAVGSIPDLGLEALGSGLVGLGMGFIGSILGMAMALIVGFNASKSGLRGVKGFAICGAFFGFVTSLFAGALDFILAVVGWLSGQPVTSGLQGLSLKVVLSLINIQIDPLWNLGLVFSNVLFLVILSIVSGTVLSSIAGVITEKFL